MTLITGFTGQLLTHALGWTLLNFCWQGALVAGMLWCVLGLLGGRSSQARYAASCAAMLLMVALPLLTFVRLAQAEYQARSVAHRMPMILDANLYLNVHAGGPNVPWALRASVALDHAMPLLLSLWLVGALFFVVRLNFGLFAANLLRSEGVEPPDDELLARFIELRQRLGVTRAVRLMHSARVQVPTVVGSLKPVVLVPVSCLTGLTGAQIEAILCHELAHVRRHDYLVSVFQSLAESLLFYHPAVWWVSRQIRRERECCCDEFAVSCCGDALDYARALSYLEEQRAALPVLALGANGGVLKMRIKRVLGLNETAGAPQFAAVLMVAALMAIGGSVAAKARAQSAPQPTQPSPPTAQVSPLTLPPRVFVVHYDLDSTGAVKRSVTSVQVAGNGKLTPVEQASVPPPPPPPPPSTLVQSQGGIGSAVTPIGVLTEAATSSTPDLACTYYDIASKAHSGTCEQTSAEKPGYLCRADDGAGPSQPQSSCESKVKRALTLQLPVIRPVGNNVPPLADGSGQLLHRVDPVYPAIARAAHVQGVVVLGATIGKDGIVNHLAVISGPPMLIGSAVDAVKQWIYKPFVFNGEPVEIRTSISVNFSLAAKAASEGDTAQSLADATPAMPSLSTVFVPHTAGTITPPTLTHSVEPEFTVEARKAKFIGFVLVSMRVDTQGLPQDVHVVHGVGMGLDEKAIDAVKQYKFTPAMKDGKPVDFHLNIEVNFQVF